MQYIKLDLLTFHIRLVQSIMPQTMKMTKITVGPYKAGTVNHAMHNEQQRL